MKPLFYMLAGGAIGALAAMTIALNTHPHEIASALLAGGLTNAGLLLGGLLGLHRLNK